MSDLKYKTVNEFIRLYRRMLDLTQDEMVSEMEDVSKTTLSEIEHGGNPTLKTIQKILKYLKSKGAPEIDATVFYS